MKKPVFSLLLLTVSVTVSSAAEQTRKIQFRTLCLKQIAGLEQVVIPSGKNLAKNLDIVLFTDISPVISGIFRDDEAVFYSLTPGPDGKPMRKVVGKTALGKSNLQLFVFFPNGEAEEREGYQIRAYDDDAKSFPLGTVRAINLASVPVRFVMSDGTMGPVIPNALAQFPHSKVVNEYNLYPVSVEFQVASSDWVKFQSVSWKANGKKRDLVIASEDSRTKQRIIQMFGDASPKVGK